MMTNKDKYLKDGVSEYDFVDFVFNQGNIGWNAKEDYCYIKNLDLLQQPVKPTLTEDEKVILRNALESGADVIFRNDEGIYFYTKPGTKGIYFNLYNNGEGYSIKELLEQ